MTRRRIVPLQRKVDKRERAHYHEKSRELDVNNPSISDWVLGFSPIPIVGEIKLHRCLSHEAEREFYGLMNSGMFYNHEDDATSKTLAGRALVYALSGLEVGALL